MKRNMGNIWAGLVVAVAVILGNQPAQAALEDYRIMAGSQLSFDPAGSFDDISAGFVVGGVVKVDVTASGIVRKILIDEVVLNVVGKQVLVGSVPTYATLTVINNPAVGGSLRLTGTGSGQLASSQINKIKASGFYQGYGSGALTGMTFQHPKASLYCDEPGCHLPAMPSVSPSHQYGDVPPGGFRYSNSGGFLQLENQTGLAGFGGPLGFQGGGCWLWG